MRALSLRGALALVVASTLALASVGLTAVSASAASVAGTVSLRSNLPDGTSISPYFTDDDPNLSASNIPGITYRAFFTSSGTTPATGSEAYDLTGSTGVMMINADQTNSLIFESDGDVPFKLTSFRMQDVGFLDSTYTASAYRNGVPTGAIVEFYAAKQGNPSTLTLPPGFSYVDEVRFTTTGGSGFEGKFWQEGFNDFVVEDSPQQADLSGLALSAGALSPAFAPDKTSYGISVASNITSTTVTPTATAPGATVTVNGVSVSSGAATGAIALNVGANVITTVVTALDGSTTKTYTTTVTRAAPPSNDANLADLTVSNASLAPTFAAGTTSYTATLPFNRASLTVTPTRAQANASITVNGVAVNSGSASGAIALNVGPNIITTVVTAQDGSTKTYTTTVTRNAASSNNQLSALTLSSGSLSPIFASGTTGYSASVSNATTSITVTPTVADASSSVTVNGVATTSGNASGAIALAVGPNTITVVTAQNGLPRTTTVAVTRSLSSNADLSALALSNGALMPTFASGTTEYTVSVNNATTSLTATPTVSDASASLTVNGVAVTSGTASGSIALAVGPNTITTTVTAPDGTTTKSYTVIVNRAASGNANLSALSLSAGTLDAGFDPATTGYTSYVPFTTSALSVTPTVAVSTASVTVNGVSVTSGTASGTIALDVGPNTITVVVTAENNATKTYTVTVNRVTPANNSLLSALSLSSGTLAPAFAAATLDYTASVGNATTSLTVTPTVADSTASVTVNGVAVTSGNASGAIGLAVGANAITVLVTAQDGTTTSLYTVTVTRAGSANNDLSNLELSAAALTPAFASALQAYSATVPFATSSLTVTPTAADSTATLKVNGVTVASGNASASVALSVGDNVVEAEVTAQNGSTRTYSVTVTRLASTDATLSALTLSAGALAPVFDSATTAYSTSVPNATTTVTVTPVVTVPDSTTTVNGVAVTSGAASGAIALPTGVSTITIVVTAGDGVTTRSYTIGVNRPESSVSSLSALAPSVGTLAPAFAAGTLTYGLETAASSITLTPTVTDVTATVEINGLPVASGSASTPITLPLGATAITTTVTAQDDTTTVYTVNVVRTGDPTVGLTHDLVVGDPAAGSTVTFTGSDITPGSTWTVTLHSAPVVLASGTIGIDGLLNVTVTLPAGIDPGAHRVALVITPPVGSPIIRTIWFTVLGNGTIGAISLAGPVFPGLVATGVDGSAMLLALLGALLAMAAGAWLIARARRRSRTVA